MSESPSAKRSTRGRRIERVVFALPRLIAGLLVLTIVAVTGANVVARYVFLAPFFWAEEVLTYVMIAFVYIAAILVTWDGHHLKMDILLRALKTPWREAVNLLSTILFIAVCAFIVVQSFEVTVLQAEFGKRSVAAEIPMVIPHSMVLIGFFFMAVAVIVRFRAYVRGDFEDEQDEQDESTRDVPNSLDTGV